MTSWPSCEAYQCNWVLAGAPALGNLSAIGHVGAPALGNLSAIGHVGAPALGNLSAIRHVGAPAPGNQNTGGNVVSIK